MKLLNLAIGAASLGLVAAPVAAQAVRAGSPVEYANANGGNSDVFYALGVGAVIAIIVIVATGGDDEPISG